MKRLLIVDDEPEIRETLKIALMGTADEILEAENGREACDFLLSNRVEAIISDIKMPKMDGIEFIAWMRANQLGYPVIVLTGHGDAELTEKALKLGAYDFLNKPCDMYVIIDRVKKALEVGVEYNRWTDESTAISNLQKLINENSVDAIDRLKTDDGTIVKKRG